MMYFPYLRGKQFELILLREQAKFLANNRQVPIIAPVRQDTTQLQKAIEALNTEHAEHVVIINPNAGDHAEDYSPILELLQTLPENGSTITGIRLNYETQNTDVAHFLRKLPTKRVALVHAGYQNFSFLKQQLASLGISPAYNIYLTNPGNRYRREFNSNSVIIEDGFRQMRNRDYPSLEFFSDLHLTYRTLGYQHFGDYLTIGEQYREGGGPAYAVALHLTYVNHADDGAVWIKHYVSDSNDGPSDPGIKAKEALDKLAKECGSHSCVLPQTEALRILLDYQSRNHYPGLGMFKKLSMWHHLCVMANTAVSH